MCGYGLRVIELLVTLSEIEPAWPDANRAVAAARRGTSVGRFICDLLVEERMDVSILAFTGIEENVRRVMQHPTWTVGTDAILVRSRHSLVKRRRSSES